MILSIIEAYLADDVSSMTATRTNKCERQRFLETEIPGGQEVSEPEFAAQDAPMGL
jgi:hypothetical protein